MINKNNIQEDRFYVGDYELYSKKTNGSLDVKRETLHITDDKQKVALIDTELDTNNLILAATIRYQYTNHLDSASLELDETGDIISYEEYHPFGTTSYRSGRNEIDVSLKRYKYVHKELDNETGLYYYGMRYYASWIARFISVDPLQFKYPELTSFQYTSNSPITMYDIDGLEGIKPDENIPEIEYSIIKEWPGKLHQTTDLYGENENFYNEPEKTQFFWVKDYFHSGSTGIFHKGHVFAYTLAPEPQITTTIDHTHTHDTETVTQTASGINQIYAINFTRPDNNLNSNFANPANANLVISNIANQVRNNTWNKPPVIGPLVHGDSVPEDPKVSNAGLTTKYVTNRTTTQTTTQQSSQATVFISFNTMNQNLNFGRTVNLNRFNIVRNALIQQGVNPANIIYNIQGNTYGRLYASMGNNINQTVFRVSSTITTNITTTSFVDTQTIIEQK